MLTRIHHFGVVVESLEHAKELWVDTYGFNVDESRSPLPDGRHVEKDNVNILDIPIGESELEITKANDSESNAGKHLAKRGQGPHHICVYSDDIDADVKRLTDNGLKIAVPTTGTPNQTSGSRIASFDPDGNLGFALEVWQDMASEGNHQKPPIGRAGTLTRIHHVAVVCSTLQEAHRLFSGIYGLNVDEVHTPLPNGRYAPNDNVRVLEYPIGESRIEATIPLDDASGSARFLASRGPGIHHICLYSEDIEYDANRLSAAGLKQLGDIGPIREDGSRIVFFHPKSNLGILVELWQDTKPR